MFAIYTPNGRTFSGPLEELRRVEKSQVTPATRHFQETDDLHVLGRKGYSLPPKAVESYREAIKRSDKKEAIRHAYHLMSSPVHVITSNDSFANALSKFKQFPFQVFPIIDQNRNLIGSLSRIQIYEFLLKNDNLSNKAIHNKKIAELFLNADSKVYVAEPVSDIRRVASLLIENQLHALPILESNGNIVGIVSRFDILKAVMTDPPLSLWC